LPGGPGRWKDCREKGPPPGVGWGGLPGPRDPTAANQPFVPKRGAARAWRRAGHWRRPTEKRPATTPRDNRIHWSGAGNPRFTRHSPPAERRGRGSGEGGGRLQGLGVRPHFVVLNSRAIGRDTWRRGGQASPGGPLSLKPSPFLFALQQLGGEEGEAPRKQKNRSGMVDFKALGGAGALEGPRGARRGYAGEGERDIPRMGPRPWTGLPTLSKPGKRDRRGGWGYYFKSRS